MRSADVLMSNSMKNIPDLIQRILDKNKGFMTVSQIAKHLTAGAKEWLGIKSNTPAKILKKKLEPVLEDRFVFATKSNATYILTPCDPADLVRAELSESKGVTLNGLGRTLKPFKKAEIAAILTELVNSGEARILVDEKLPVKFFAGSGNRIVMHEPETVKSEPEQPKPLQSGEYTLAKFKAAYDELHKFRDYPRIPDLRRKLDWPREVFDEMVRKLRDNMTIQIEQADESLFTHDEILDCFVDENNYKMGLLIWNVR